MTRELRRVSVPPSSRSALALALALLAPTAPVAAQPAPKCAARSAEAAPSCAASFAGSWTGLTGGGATALFDLYAMSALSAADGSFNVSMVHGLGWASGTGVLDAATGDVNVSLVGGGGPSPTRLRGAASADCQTISWDNDSVWQRFTQPPRPLRVHIAPHTHNDVGWRMTYLEYYNGRVPSDYGQNVSLILNSVVPALQADPRRRFSYVEQAYFQLHYERAAPETQAAFRELVSSRQITFLNGAWSMHDEANPTFVDMLDNTATGHRAILENFGEAALPNVTWQARILHTAEVFPRVPGSS